MDWFRSNIRHGSRLALLALAIQFVVSFGHFHGIGAQAAPSVTSIAQAAIQSQQPSSSHDSDQQPADICAICAVMALANTALFAAPPTLLLPQAMEFRYLISGAAFVHLDHSRVAFQSRAPPAA
jgi:hypothetical protein